MIEAFCDSIPVGNKKRKFKKLAKKHHSMNSNYGSSNYWEERYEKSESFYDWYQDFSGLKDTFSKYLKPEFKILMVGCGNSKLGQEMIEEGGYKEIINIDISNNVISHMREMTKGIKGLTFETMNVLDLKYDDKTFDAVIDKGTLDALLCGEGSTENGNGMLAEVSRVLKEGGVYINITYGAPSFRISYFEQTQYNWTIETLKIEKFYRDQEKDYHYFYVMHKK